MADSEIIISGDFDSHEISINKYTYTVGDISEKVFIYTESGIVFNIDACETFSVKKNMGVMKHSVERGGDYIDGMHAELGTLSIEGVVSSLDGNLSIINTIFDNKEVVYVHNYKEIPSAIATTEYLDAGLRYVIESISFSDNDAYNTVKISIDMTELREFDVLTSKAKSRPVVPVQASTVVTAEKVDERSNADWKRAKSYSVPGYGATDAWATKMGEDEVSSAWLQNIHGYANSQNINLTTREGAAVINTAITSGAIEWQQHTKNSNNHRMLVKKLNKDEIDNAVKKDKEIQKALQDKEVKNQYDRNTGGNAK